MSFAAHTKTTLNLTRFRIRGLLSASTYIAPSADAVPPASPPIQIRLCGVFVERGRYHLGWPRFGRGFFSVLNSVLKSGVLRRKRERDGRPGA